MVKKEDIKKESKNKDVNKQKLVPKKEQPIKKSSLEGKPQTQVSLKTKVQQTSKDISKLPLKDIASHPKEKIKNKKKKEDKIKKVEQPEPPKHKPKVEKNLPKPSEEKTKNIENVESFDNYYNYITEKLSKLNVIKEKVKQKVQLDRKLIIKAVKVLLEFNEKTKNSKNLLDTNEGFIYVEISFNKLPNGFSIRPIQM